VLPGVAVAQALARIEARNAALGAFCKIFDAEARQQAAMLEAAVRRGPLSGLTFAAKDAFEVAGHPCTAGSAAWSGRVSTETAAAVTALSGAGAVLVGKTCMGEFSYDSWGVNPAQGTPRNPLSPDGTHVPGGSSSGSAVAVAAGMVPLALGTDTGGSVRIPAALCGAVGFKPRHGVISTAGVIPLAPSFDCVGLIGADPDIVARAYAVFDPAAGVTAGAGPAGPRIAVPAAAELEGARPDVIAGLEALAAALASYGADCRRLKAPTGFTAFEQPMGRMIRFEAWQWHRHWLEAWRGEETVIMQRLRSGAVVEPGEYAALRRRRESDMAAFDAAFGAFDAILLPTTPFPALPLTEIDRDRAPLSHFCRGANYLDLPAIAVPWGRSPEGMPLSVQVVVPRHAAATCFRIARMIIACGIM